MNDETLTTIGLVVVYLGAAAVVAIGGIGIIQLLAWVWRLF